MYFGRWSHRTRIFIGDSRQQVPNFLKLGGHVSTDTTMEYANVDLHGLRRVALSEAEVCS